jgi:hypothetical protein
MALADQNFWLVTGAIDQDQRRGVLRAEIRMVIGFFSSFTAVAASLIPSPFDALE